MEDPVYDVIIVGAGMSGLTTAQHLKKKGITSCIILEARNRIGGRLFTSEIAGVPIDLGGAWVHGTLNNPVMDYFGETLSDDLLMSSVDNYWCTTTPINEYLFDNGTLVSEEEIKRFEPKYEEFLDKLRKLAENSDSKTSLKEGIQIIKKEFTHLSERELRLLNWYLFKQEVWMGSGSKDIALSERADEEVWLDLKGAHCVLKHGWSKFTKLLSDSLNIQLEHEVTSIDYSSVPAKVTTKNGKKFLGKTVLVTIPIGLLQVCMKSMFTPPLSTNKTSIINKIQMGGYDKVIMEFDHCFWSQEHPNSKHFLGSISSDTDNEHCLFMDYYKLKGVPVMIAFMIADLGKAMDRENSQKILELALTALKNMWNMKEIPQPVNFIITHWNKDPYSYGAYSYPSLGTSQDDFNDLKKPEGPLQHLFFGGEATVYDYMGTVHGAFLSGVEQAELISEHLLSTA